MVQENPHFLFLAWLQETWRAYTRATVQPRSQGRHSLSPQQYVVALLMNYLGSFSLGELSQLAGVAPALLKKWRSLPEFLWLMDWSKSRFGKNFQEILSLEDFSWPAYLTIAGEFSCLEESLRLRIRTGLYPVLRDLGARLFSQYNNGLFLETSISLGLSRLFQFFWALEGFWPSPARPQLRDRLLPLALEVVWPALGLREGDELSVKLWEDPDLSLRLKKVLAIEISKVFQKEDGFHIRSYRSCL